MGAQRVPGRATSDPISIPYYSRCNWESHQRHKQYSRTLNYLGEPPVTQGLPQSTQRVLWRAISDLRYNPEYSRLIGRAINDPMITTEYSRVLTGGLRRGGQRGGEGVDEECQYFSTTFCLRHPPLTPTPTFKTQFLGSIS